MIGQGSFGTVFRADSPDGPVAVKLLRPDLAGNPDVVHRFLRERSVLLRLTHPGIVRVRDLVAEGDVLALVMDLVPGPDLRAHLHSRGGIPAVEAARLVADVAAALSYAHGQGVVHRDIKPENVLLRDGSPRLTDFGIARLVATAATMAGQHEVLGTPAYLAPELAVGDEPSSAVDVYACGVLLYELVAGRPPFVADHPLSVVHQHVTDVPQRPAGMPEELWRTVGACLAKSPEQRPDADTLRVLLTEYAARPVPAAGHHETRPVPVLPAPSQTQTMPHYDRPAHATQPVPRSTADHSPGSVGRVRIEPRRAAASQEDDWHHVGPPPPRTNWLVHGAVLVVVAALFFAAGFWAGDAGRRPEPSPPAGKAAPSASPSAAPRSVARYLNETAYVQIANGWGPVELNKATGNTGVDDGGPLALAGTTYDKGLGAHAPSHIRIYPPPGCTRFKAVVGIDGSSTGPGGGTVTFQVHADGQLRHDTGVVTRDAQPMPIDVDVTGAKTVDLIVTDGGDGNHWDISDWADAHLTCASG
ncbi:MAG TPA: NPCBM/NEW2 domain-containing protein [Micromonosporaceae bacterium]